MPLSWDATRVEDLSVIEDNKEWEITELLIFSTMGVGIGEITKDNAHEFWIRMQMWAMACGHQPLAVSLAQVNRRIGLKTNVSPKTKTAFHAQCTRQLRDRVATLQRHQS
jgi:hypothetical protein